MSEPQNIIAALAAAQRNMGKALKSANNPHFRSKYADLASVMDACLPALNEAGIAVIQPVIENEFGRYVATQFLFGEDRLECRIPVILGKNDMQGLGSALTYARRYGLMALAGIAPEDDDGNAAAATMKGAQPPQSWAQTITDELPEGSTPAQKAEAVATALIDQFKRKKSAQQLSNEWDRRTDDRAIPTLEKHFPDLHGKVVDAYETRMIELEPPREAAE